MISLHNLTACCAGKKRLVQCEHKFYLVSSCFLYGNTIEKDSAGIDSITIYALRHKMTIHDTFHRPIVQSSVTITSQQKCVVFFTLFFVVVATVLFPTQRCMIA